MNAQASSGELSEQLVRELRRAEYVYEDSAFTIGAIRGAIGFGFVLLVFHVLPEIWLILGWASSWWRVITLAVTLSIWSVVGAVVGGSLLALLSLTLARSRESRTGAAWGMMIGFIVGALSGSGYAFYRAIVWGGQTADSAWVFSGDAITASSLTLGSLFAIFGSLAGAIFVLSITSSKSAESIRSDELPESGRFQIGITRLLLLTTMIAIAFAIPVNLVSPLFRTGLHSGYSLAVHITVVLVFFMIVPIMTWPVIRGPAIFRRLVQAWAGWQGQQTARKELEQLVSHKRDQCAASRD